MTYATRIGEIVLSPDGSVEGFAVDVALVSPSPVLVGAGTFVNLFGDDTERLSEARLGAFHQETV